MLYHLVISVSMIVCVQGLRRHGVPRFSLRALNALAIIVIGVIIVIIGILAQAVAVLLQTFYLFVAGLLSHLVECHSLH